MLVGECIGRKKYSKKIYVEAITMGMVGPPSIGEDCVDMKNKNDKTQ